MFSIEPNFNFREFEKDMQNTLMGMRDEVAETMFKACTQMVDLARTKTFDQGGFGNITWDLRASIGCILSIDGDIQPEHIYFPPIAESKDGHEIGIAFAREIALLVDDGMPTVVFVAGMQYASFVESKGKDVISMESVGFHPEFKKLLNQL